MIYQLFWIHKFFKKANKIINTYTQQRAEGESFIHTYQRLGVTPFKEAAYKNAKKKDKVESAGDAS